MDSVVSLFAAVLAIFAALLWLWACLARVTPEQARQRERHLRFRQDGFESEVITDETTPASVQDDGADVIATAKEQTRRNWWAALFTALAAVLQAIALVLPHACKCVSP